MSPLQTTTYHNESDNQRFHSQWNSMKQLLHKQKPTVDPAGKSSSSEKSKRSRIRRLFRKRTRLDSATEDEEEEEEDFICLQDIEESPEEDFCGEEQDPIAKQIDALKRKINEHNEYRCYYVEYSRSFRSRRAIVLPPVDLPDPFKRPNAVSTVVAGKQVAMCKNMWNNQRRRRTRKVLESIWEKKVYY